MKRTSALLAGICLLATSSASWSQDQIADVLQDPALDMKRPEGRAKAVAKIKAIEDARAVKTRAKAEALGLKMRVEKPNGAGMEAVSVPFPTTVPLQVGGSAPTKFFHVVVSAN